MPQTEHSTLPNISRKASALLRNCISNCFAKRWIFFCSTDENQSKVWRIKFFLASKANWMIFLLLLSSMEIQQNYCCVSRMKSYVLLVLACLMKCGNLQFCGNEDCWTRKINRWFFFFVGYDFWCFGFKDWNMEYSQNILQSGAKFRKI